MFRKTLMLTALVFVSVSCGMNTPSGSHFVPKKPTLGLDIIANMRDFADILRTNNPDLDKILNDAALTAVTQEFGPTVIPAQAFPLRSEIAISDVKPWSSWWFPKREDILFSDAQGKYTSALTKYDLVRRKRAEQNRNAPVPGSAADFERKNYNSNSAPWEGLCDAWSLASISKPEPKRSVTIQLRGANVTFTVAELKALLLKTYEGVEDSGLKYYGQKFTGDVNGWIYPDIFPDQFHRFLEVQLFEVHKPFVMDHDAGVQVWNNPVYKANFLMDSIPNEPNSVFVRAWVYTVESSEVNNKDFVGTREAVREYDYVLQGTRNSNGELVVNSGYWVKGPDGIDSRRDHPDYIIRVPNPDKLVRKSLNPEIDVALVDEILAKSY